MTRGHLPANYQPIFSNNLPIVVQKEENGVTRSPRIMQAELDQILQKMTILEEIGRDIVVLLKCILCSCAFVWIAIMWGLCKNA